MAQIPDVNVPDVTAAGIPNDYQNIQTDPNQFGAGVGQAIGGVGQSIEENAQRLGNVWGQVQTDGAINNTMSTLGKTLDGYTKLRGQDALNAQDATNKAVQDTIDQGRSSLSTPLQQFQFDQTMRTFQERYVNGIIRSHANQQGFDYARSTNSDSINIGLSGVAASANDPDQVEAFAGKVRQGYMRQVQLEGNENDPDQVNNAMLKANQAVYEQQAKSLLGQGNPMAAKKVLDDHADVLAGAPNYDALTSLIGTASRRIQAVQVGDEFLRRGGIAGPPGGATFIQAAAPATADPKAAITTALLNQESGNNNATPASVNGAIGPGQIMPATFAQYAKPGENINNPDDNRAVTQRIVDDLYQKAGGDPARVAVGYFSGPGNIAPAGSPTPYIRDTMDGNGQSVSGYVQQVSARLQRSNNLMDKATMLAQVDQQYGTDPQLAQAIRSHITEQWSVANLAQQSNELAKRDAIEQSANGYVSTILKGATPDIIGKIADDPNLDAAHKESLANFANAYVRKGVDGDAAHYGPGYYDALSKINLPSGDPNRITSVNQLVARAGDGGDLNAAGVDQLRSLMTSMQKPEGVADGAVQKGMLDYAKHQISYEADYGFGLKMLDPKGQDAFNAQFIPAFYKNWNAIKAQGKDPADVMDRAMVDRIAAPFKRTPAQIAADQAAESAALPSSGAAGNASGTPIDLSSKESIRAAFGSGQLSRQQARDALVKGGFFEAPPQPPVMQ